MNIWNVTMSIRNITEDLNDISNNINDILFLIFNSYKCLLNLNTKPDTNYLCHLQDRMIINRAETLHCYNEKEWWKFHSRPCIRRRTC